MKPKFIKIGSYLNVDKIVTIRCYGDGSVIELCNDREGETERYYNKSPEEILRLIDEAYEGETKVSNTPFISGFTFADPKQDDVCEWVDNKGIFYKTKCKSERLHLDKYCGNCGKRIVVNEGEK